MDLAHIIKGLLTVECSFRIIQISVASALNEAYLLWGWQPSFLLKLIAGAERVLGKREMRNNITGIAVYDNVNEYLYEQNDTTDISGVDSSRSIWPNGSREDIVDLPPELPTIEAVCLFSESLLVFSFCGIAIFVLLTGIVR